MLTPAEPWERSGLFRQLAENETEAHLRRHLAMHALALAQTGREDRTRGSIGESLAIVSIRFQL